MKGILACDIDGTLTDSPFHMPENVVSALHEMQENGWSLIFITGRPYVWGVRPLLALDFPYYLAVINGANLIEMPSGILLEEKLIDAGTLNELDEACQKYGTDYVGYTGYSGRDIVYYRPEKFDYKQLAFLKERSAALGEVWEPIDDLAKIPFQGFASIKCFGGAAACNDISKAMECKLSLHAPVIRDPFNMDHYVVQATVEGCTKGEVLKRFALGQRCDGPIVAAGDDFNDVSMLKVANIRIVMATAPREVLEMADIIAAPASEGGLAAALYRLL